MRRGGFDDAEDGFVEVGLGGGEVAGDGEGAYDVGRKEVSGRR